VDERTCGECGGRFLPRQHNCYFCSTKCRKRAADRKRVVRDRGERTCEWCGQGFRARGLYQRFCGVECKHADRAVKECPVPWRQCPECGKWRVGGRPGYCGRECVLAHGRRRYRDTFVGVAATNPVVEHTCPECGTEFTSRRYSAVRKFCSPACGQRAHHRHRRHLERAVIRAGEYFTLREIAERDGWRCHICRRKVAEAQATLDHLVPLALGGVHTRTNVALAHHLCNSKRSHTGPAQLRLTA
jgi:5-methylcytosine-specific restriction endonuclease McrA